ncbi:MAG: metallopeptidase family protein [Anaerolineales bacterium]|nr:metallopeptidase family protein [Anaerolineales bacterium]
MPVTRQRFEDLVFACAEALLAELPPHLRAEAATVLLEVADQPTPEQDPEGAGLLGLYEGVPLVERRPDDVFFQPDRITLFYRPLLEMAGTEAQLRREIRVTLVHELGHFFGFDEDELEQRGWG